jgi:tRNA(Ile2)-agmatinylcytidine synthase
MARGAAFHIGVDSTDSATLGMCTTYLGARLLAVLEANGVALDGAPQLVRLNPNVPWKTRGNGAVAVRCRAPEDRADDIFALARDLVDELAVLEDPQTNPGLAVLAGEPTEQLRALYGAALHQIVELDDACAAGEAAGALMHGWKSCRGLIGALAAIGADIEAAHTWEVITYRRPERYGTKRSVDAASIGAASRRHPTTFFNVAEDGTVVCVPHSPCPVLFGIRGTDPADTFAAASEIESEAIERWVLWRTNQHTDAHIEEVASVREAAPYRSIQLAGAVASEPAYRRGGHLYFQLRDREGLEIACAAYRQTRSFRENLSRLVVGDEVTVWGAVRPADEEHPIVVNLEKMRLDALVPVYDFPNPQCPRCGGRMESMGRGQGKRCKKCRLRLRHADKSPVLQPRGVEVGPIEPPPTTWRHLYRPWRMPPASDSEGPGTYWGLDKPRCG